MSAVDITRAMLTDLDSMKGGSVLDATQVHSLDNETSEHTPFRSPSACETVYTEHVHVSFILNKW